MSGSIRCHRDSMAATGTALPIKWNMDFLPFGRQYADLSLTGLEAEHSISFLCFFYPSLFGKSVEPHSSSTLSSIIKFHQPKQLLILILSLCKQEDFGLNLSLIIKK